MEQNQTRDLQILVTEQSSTEDLIRALEQAQYPYQRRHAAIILGNRDAKEATPHLLNALKDPEEVVQSGAAKALAKIGDSTLSEKLIINTKAPDPRVRQYSAYVLGQWSKNTSEKNPDVVAALEAIAEDDDELVRVEVVYALYEIGSYSSKATFIKRLKDEDPRVRMHSATALGNIKTPDAAEALVKGLENESDDGVRTMIAAALGKHGSAYAVTALVATLPRERENVRADIAIKLGEVKTPLVIKALTDLMLKDSSSRVRSNAAQSLLKAKDPSTVPALAKALKDRVAIVRIPASQALIGLADKSVMDDLIKALGDTDERVAANAAKTLIRLGDLNAVHKLMPLLDSPRRSEASLAISVLQAITYRDYGSDVNSWKKWYGETFNSSDRQPASAGSQ